MRYGEIIELGRHRLMCGDATCREDVMRLVDGEGVDLVLTDPPYGISVVDPKTKRVGGQGHRYAPVIGDNGTAMMREHWQILRLVSLRHIIWGGQNFTDFLPVSSGWIFWDKDKCTDKLSFSDGELAYTDCMRRIKKYVQKWNGSLGKCNPLNGYHHPTQKPVELHAKILEDFTQPDDVILDCFGGSGTTLIACEITGRKCLMMEISPEYCGIIRERYENLIAESLPLEN